MLVAMMGGLWLAYLLGDGGFLVLGMAMPQECLSVIFLREWQVAPIKGQHWWASSEGLVIA